MAIPFYEPKEEQSLQQQGQANPLPQQYYEEVDQVDGPAVSNPPNMSSNEIPANLSPPPTTEQDVLAWKLLALAMCKALKDHYQQNMSTTADSSSTAVIHILPNGQVKPSWN